MRTGDSDSCTALQGKRRARTFMREAAHAQDRERLQMSRAGVEKVVAKDLCNCKQVLHSTSLPRLRRSTSKAATLCTVWHPERVLGSRIEAAGVRRGVWLGSRQQTGKREGEDFERASSPNGRKTVNANIEHLERCP